MKNKFLTDPLRPGVKLWVCEDYDAMSAKAAAIVGGAMQQKKDFVLGLATGSSPVGLYRGLIDQYEAGILDFSDVRTYNLDEYYPIAADDPQSYVYFMFDKLFGHVNIKKENVHLPDGSAADPDRAAAEYEASLPAVDLQVLGIGSNGHIGFNEPADSFVYPTHTVTLTANTVKDNSRFFASPDLVPKRALSMGIGTIMRARSIVMVANGLNKANALRDALEGPVVPQVPASILQFHQNVTVVADKAAASLITSYR